MSAEPLATGGDDTVIATHLSQPTAPLSSVPANGMPAPVLDPERVPEPARGVDPVVLPAALLAPVDGDRARGRVWERLGVWLLFGMIFSLLPLIAVAIKGMLAPGGASLEQVLGGGEMFIVGAVISAGAVGELFSTLRARPSTAWEQMAAGFCFFCSVCNSMAYLSVRPDNPHTVVVASFISFGVTYLASGACVAMAAFE